MRHLCETVYCKYQGKKLMINSSEPESKHPNHNSKSRYNKGNIDRFDDKINNLHSWKLDKLKKNQVIKCKGVFALYMIKG